MKRILAATVSTALLAVAQSPTPVTPPPASPTVDNPAATAGAKGTNSPAEKDKGTSKLINASERDFKPRDVFRYSVLEDPAPSQSAQEAVVTDAGEVHFPVSGQFTEYVTVDVRGRKLADIRAEVKRMLDERFYQNATVQLDLASVNNSASASVAGIAKARVFGEINGTIPIPENEEVFLSDALIGLGRNEMANLKKVKLHRKDPVTGVTKSFTVNVDKILKENARNMDIRLQDGDRIEVPAVGIRF